MIINLSGIDFSGNGGGGGGGSYVLPVASESTLGGVKIGSGITIDENGAISAEGGSAGGPKVVYLNQLSKQEKKDLYDEIVAYSTADNFPAGDYRFLNYSNDNDYTGYYELFVSRIIGNTVTLSAIFKGRSNTKVLIRVHRLFSDGDWSNDVSQTGDFPYALPTASDSALGGVKVGSGLTIDSGGTLSVSGGSAQSDYLIVDALSAVTNPQEGQMAQVRTQEETIEYQKLYVTDSSTAPLQEGYWGCLKIDGVGYRPVYISNNGNSFYWNWPDGDGNNPTKWTDGEWEGRTYQYKFDFSGEHPVFQIIFPEGSDIELVAQAQSDGTWYDIDGISTGTGTETVYKYSSPYIYQDGKWIPIYKTYVRSDIESFSTSAQTAAFVNEAVSQIKVGRAPFVFDDERNKMMVLDSYGNDFVTYICNREGTDRYISCSSTKHEQDEYNAIGIKTWENNWVPSPEYVSAYFRVNTAGTIYDCDGREYYISFDDEFPRILLLYQGGEGYPPQSEAYVEWRTAYKTLNGDNEEKWYYVFGGKVGIGTTIYNGVWGCLQDDWTMETLSWTSGATYESQNYPPYTGSTS